MRLATSLLIDDPAENMRAIGRGELRKAKSEEPWYWPDEFCLAVPAGAWSPCCKPRNHKGKHSWEPSIPFPGELAS